MRLAILIALLGACGENRTPAESPDAGGGALACLPDLDGVITAGELPLTLETAADYLVSPDGTAVDVAGEVDDAGRRVWDLSAESAGDTRVAIEAVPVADQWYAGQLPGGDFVIAALVPGGLDGVYSLGDDGLLLHALASRAEGESLLIYDAPVPVLRLPMEPGDRFTASSDNSGTLDGLPYNGTDTYEVEVDAVGRVELPLVTFTQAHRVRTRVEVAPAAGGITASRRQVSFFFECFGEVARITSRDDEPDPDFTTAAEVRRLAL